MATCLPRRCFANAALTSYCGGMKLHQAIRSAQISKIRQYFSADMSTQRAEMKSQLNPCWTATVPCRKDWYTMVMVHSVWWCMMVLKSVPAWRCWTFFSFLSDIEIRTLSSSINYVLSACSNTLQPHKVHNLTKSCLCVSKDVFEKSRLCFYCPHIQNFVFFASGCSFLILYMSCAVGLENSTVWHCTREGEGSVGDVVDCEGGGSAAQSAQTHDSIESIPIIQFRFISRIWVANSHIVRTRAERSLRDALAVVIFFGKSPSAYTQDDFWRRVSNKQAVYTLFWRQPCTTFLHRTHRFLFEPALHFAPKRSHEN